MNKRLPFLVLVVALVALTWKYFKEIIREPDQYLFSLVGDAIKSYYCSVFYIKYNSGFRFTGMNYPYGESLLYTDAQPLLIETLRFFHQNVAALPNYGVGIINLLVVLSPILGGIVLYFILRHLRLPRLYAVPVTVIITFLSPQFLRFTDQLSLSYIFIVPVLWLLILKMFATRKLLYSVLFVLFLLVMGSIHPYVVVIGAVFLLAYLLVYVLQNLSSIKPDWKFLVGVLATALVPVIIFNSAVKIFDYIPDRPTDPYGFFAYHSTFSSVFVPVVSPVKDVWQQTFKTDEPVWEGMAYIGIAGFVVFVLSLWKVFNYLFKPKNTTTKFKQRFRLVLRPALPPMLQTGLWAAVLILLFSFCIPFRIDGFRWIPDLIPTLKQFRALGRFAWIFYYIFTVYTAYYLYQLYRYQRQRNAGVFGISLVVLLLVAWAVDARFTVKVPSDALKSRREAENFLGDKGNYRELLATANRRPEEFQALLPLPYYHIGSEAFWIDGTPEILGESMKASFNTGLSIAAVMMGRTSLEQTLSLMQLVGNPALPRPLARKLPSAKPLLLMYSKEELTENEQYLLRKAEKIVETEQMAFYSLPVSAFANTAQQEIARFEMRQDSLVQQGDLLVSENRADIVFEKYTNGSGAEEGKPAFLDKGSVWGKKTPLALFSGMVPNANDSTEYELSIWYNFEGGKAPELFVRQYDTHGNELWMTPIAVKRATDLFGNWVRAAGTFKVTHATTRLEVTLNGKNMTVDNLLIKPKKLDVYYQSPGLKMVVKNNIPLQPGL